MFLGASLSTIRLRTTPALHSGMWGSGPIAGACTVCNRIEAKAAQLPHPGQDMTTARGVVGMHVNPLLTCLTCGVTVHKVCYGLNWSLQGQTIPEVYKWQCDPCVAKIQSPACAICNLPHKGAMKRLADVPSSSKDGKDTVPQVRFAHVLCSMWTPEVGYSDWKGLKLVQGLDRVHYSRWNRRCGLCGKRQGLMVQCCHTGKCNVTFHPLCAALAGYHLDVELGIQELLDGQQARKTVYLTVYCDDHRPVAEPQPGLEEQQQQQPVSESAPLNGNQITGTQSII